MCGRGPALGGFVREEDGEETSRSAVFGLEGAATAREGVVDTERGEIRRGGQEGLPKRKKYYEDAAGLKTGLPIPNTLRDGHVLVKVQAGRAKSCLSKPICIQWIQVGVLSPTFLARRPHVAEGDVAGLSSIQTAQSLMAGDRVFGTLRTGPWLNTSSAPPRVLALIPANVSSVEAAGPRRRSCNCVSGSSLAQTVFINGGSSGVGLSAIQIAKSMGCKVVATASGKNKDLLLSLGTIQRRRWSSNCSRNPPSPKFHAILDGRGLTDPALYLNSAAYLAPGGAYATAGDMPNTLSQLADVLRQLFEGFLRPPGSAAYPGNTCLPSFCMRHPHLSPIPPSPFLINLGQGRPGNSSRLGGQRRCEAHCRLGVFLRPRRRLEGIREDDEQTSGGQVVVKVAQED
ncbi:hypothetical protein B0H14DRAFT_2588666 [Mycena olivaceomarginata]|nr:hypothetical protein B0H14DRAFT_2588666 [Mycena olivaceomarginata]